MKTLRIRRSGEQIPVGKILCIGRNYQEHTREMKADVPESPVVFLKPSSALLSTGEDIVIPSVSREVHHEVELVVAISREGKNISEAKAKEYILGYAVGLDMTMRDVQAEAKRKGLPWSTAKGFDTSAPLSDVIEALEVKDPSSLEIMCNVNGTVRQRTFARAMIFSVDQLLSYVSTIFTLERGDLIFTGTPAGVDRVVAGDIITAELINYVSITHKIC